MSAKRGMISASLMCASMLRLEDDISALGRAGVDYLHFDIMDGCFVPNITLGSDLIRQVRGVSGIPFDIHLMIENPESKLEWFDVRPGDFVSVHAEAARHMQRALQKLRDRGARPAVALNPATPLSACDYILDDAEMILLMTVNPGFAGQKLIEAAVGKIADLKDYLIRKGHGDILIEVDGNVSFENAVRMRRAGADVFVCGTSSVFRKELGIGDAVSKFHGLINAGQLG